ISGDDTTCESGGRDKRMLYLSNGEEIWDMSGNVFNWVDETIDCNGGYVPSCVNMPEPTGWQEYSAITDWGAYSQKLLGPSNLAWTSANGMGKIYPDADDSYPAGTNIHAFQRGGNYLFEDLAGVFALNLHIAPSNSHGTIGFRCSFSG
ncbi:MAG: hypothetical protein ACQER9_03890, partial [Nanobdellota archaeon]